MSSKPRTEAPAARRERRPTIWSTASFRMAGAFALIFGLGGAALLMTMDVAVMRFAEAEVREGLAHQMAIMRADADLEGGEALVEMLHTQERNQQARRYLFLVAAPDGSRYSNGLNEAALGPGKGETINGFRVNLPTAKRPARWPDQKPNMTLLSQRANDGTLLAIGRDTQHLEELRAGIRSVALWGGSAMILLAILSGLTMGWVFLRRLENANASVSRIIAGRSSERLPAIGVGREFDELADNLNRMLDRQEAAMNALRTMSVGIAHDLRSPLSRLRNRLEELAVDPNADPERVELAMAEMENVTQLFEALLTLARMEGGGFHVDFELVDAAALMIDVAEAYRPVVEEAGGVLDLGAGLAEAEPVMLRGSPILLRQALSNLIENALVHATPAQGPLRLTLDLTATPDQATLSLADNGPGVPEHERENVLRRFYRLDPSRSRPGAGLGLPMCAASAKVHDGEIRLDDNAPGLKISLILPRTQKTAIT